MERRMASVFLKSAIDAALHHSRLTQQLDRKRLAPHLDFHLLQEKPLLTFGNPENAAPESRQIELRSRAVGIGASLWLNQLLSGP